MAVSDDPFADPGNPGGFGPPAQTGHPTYRDPTSGLIYVWDATSGQYVPQPGQPPALPTANPNPPPADFTHPLADVPGGHAPTLPSGGGGASSLSGGIYSPWNTPFTAPSMLNLGGQPGLSFIPPAPTFDFTPPTADQAANDPGYQFTFGEGERAVEQSAAGRGALNTSGSLKNLVDYGQAAATTQYNSVYNRAYTLAQSKFNPLMDQYHTLASAGQRQNELNYDEAWNQYLQHYKEYTDWQNSDWTRKYQSASLQ